MSVEPDYVVSERLLARDDFQQACRVRDFKRMFELMKQWDIVSQDRLAAPVEGLTQSRVSRIMRGHERVTTLEVMERISDGLHIPGHYLGFAARSWETGGSEPITAIPPQQTVNGVSQPSSPAGELRDRSMTLDIDIDKDGWSTLTYRYELYNGTDTPFTSLSRELWFEHMDAPLKLEALPTGDDSRNVIIERKHETATTIRFACRLFPALPAGETAIISFRATGGRFVYDHYWRQGVPRLTDVFTIRLRHAGITALSKCSALEERPDGSEISATESLTWKRDDDGINVELVRTNLRPNQSVTLRWDTPRD